MPRPRPSPRTSPTVIPPHLDDDSVRHALKLAFITMRKELDASLRALDLTVPKWRALDYIQRRPGVTHTELVTCLEIEASSVTSLVEGLERRGWARRKRSDDDARVKRLYITPSGRRIMRSASVAIEPVDRRIEGCLGTADAAALKRLLGRVTESLRRDARARGV